MQADLAFAGTDAEIELSEQMVSVAVGYRIAEAFDLRLTVGAILDGEVGTASESFDLTSGWLAALDAVMNDVAAPETSKAARSTALPSMEVVLRGRL